MRIFLSYSSSDRAVAASLAATLGNEGHDVFWDREDLPPGQSFDDRIRTAIDRSDLFVFLVSPASVQPGKYTLTELKFLRERWQRLAGRVLPVVVSPTPLDQIPAHLKAVTLLEPEGNLIAEVVAAVRRLGMERRRPALALRLGAAFAGAAAIALVSWLALGRGDGRATPADDRPGSAAPPAASPAAGGANPNGERDRGPDAGAPGQPVRLSIGLSGLWYKEEASGAVQRLRAATPYLEALRGGRRQDGTELMALLDADEGGPGEGASPLPLLHFRIVNNSGDTIIVDRLRLEVKKSAIDVRPLFWTSSKVRHTTQVMNGAFFLGNDGWGASTETRFAFDVVGRSALPAADARTSRRFARPIDDVKGGSAVLVPIWDALAGFGTDLSVLRRNDLPFDRQADGGKLYARFQSDLEALRSAIGAVGDEPIFAVGEISYRLEDGRRDSVKIRQRIEIVWPGPVVAPAIVALVEYQMQLRPEGEHYTVDRVVAHEVAAGRTEGIDVRVYCEKSSLHDMTAAIRVGDRWIASSDPLRLEYYRPIHAAWAPQE